MNGAGQTRLRPTAARAATPLPPSSQASARATRLTSVFAAVGEALARRSATAIALALFLWLLLVFGGDLGLMGSALVLRIDIQTLFALALLNPLQVFKMAAILAIRGSLEVLGPAGLYALRAYGDRLSLLFLVILLAWAILPLAFTYLIFRQRGAL